MAPRQCSPRGGTLELELEPDRLRVRGRAVILFRGTIDVD
jgi:hypothetical protein